MNKIFLTTLASFLLLLPVSFAVAAVDPTSIQGVHGGNVCTTDVNGGVGTPVPGGYYNTGGAVAGVDAAIFPAGFFDTPSNYCFQDTERWINLGPGIGGDTVFQYGWYRFNATFIGTPTAPVQYPTGYAGKADLKEHYSFTGGQAAAALSASIVANPTSIVLGEQSLITWSSTGAVSCAGTNFDTGGATSGSVAVTPAQTTSYTVTCTGTSGQNTTAATINHNATDADTNPAVTSDLQTNGGVAVGSGTGFAAEKAGMDRVCFDIHGAGTTAGTWGARKYKSPKNNAVVRFNGTSWSRVGAKSFNSHLSASFTCVTQASAVQTASASATVSVADKGLQVSCRAHPPRASLGEDVLWSSTAIGPAGTYTYSWSGTEGLSGTSNEVFKKYTIVGQKDAWLTVKYTPGIGIDPPAPPGDVSQPGAPTQQGGAGADRPLFLRYLNSLSSFLLFDKNKQAFDVNNVETVQMIEGTVQGATAATVNHAEMDAYNSPAVVADAGANGITNLLSSGFAAEKTTMDRVCSLIDGSGSTASTWGARKYKSPKNNSILKYSGSAWTRIGAKSFNSHLSSSFVCIVPAGPPQPPATTTPSVPAVEPQTVTVKCESGVYISAGTGQCTDGIDNNGDGLVDALDPGCLIGLAYNPNGTEGAGSGVDGQGGLPQCADGIDNNGDGNIDYPEDPGCTSATDNLEQSEPADVSLVMTPPIIKKGQSCTINVSARNVKSCTLSGTGITRIFVPIAGIVAATQLLTPALSQSATYNLSCTGTNGKVVAKSVDCKVAPTFEEF